jgi:hypothetical protein
MMMRLVLIIPNLGGTTTIMENRSFAAVGRIIKVQ